jgi:hypothetical protein
MHSRLLTITNCPSPLRCCLPVMAISPCVLVIVPVVVAVAPSFFVALGEGVALGLVPLAAVLVIGPVRLVALRVAGHMPVVVFIPVLVPMVPVVVVLPVVAPVSVLPVAVVVLSMPVMTMLAMPAVVAIV